MKVLTYALILKRMSMLPKVLMLVARLGGTVHFVSATQGKVTLTLVAPESISHRFAPQLRRIVDVIELAECHAEQEDDLGITGRELCISQTA